MGTRHLIAVYENGQPCIAQYGQWDGYPSHCGAKILDWLQSHDPEWLKKAVMNCSWFTDEELEAADLGASPQLSRDVSFGILDIVYAARGCKLSNSIEFAAEGLFCEWAYVIDFDAKTFEVYEGFQQDDCKGRFAVLDNPDEEYRPVSFLKSWPLDALPSKEEFLEAFQDTE